MAFKFNVFTGSLDYYEPAPSTSVPTVVTSVYTVAAGSQAFAPLDIITDGETVIDGELVFA